jgi:hypothetical protein
MEDRSWAEGMTQEQFNVEYPRRVLGADMIPDVTQYIDNVFGQGVYGDTNVNPEDIRPERDGLHGDEPEKQNMNAPGLFTCNYCGRDNLKSKFGLMAHMRHCKSKKG